MAAADRPGPVLVPPARGWRRRAACRRSPVDLVLIEDRPDALDEDDPAARLSTPTEIAQARAVCRACPVAGDCLAATLRGPEVAGMAGGRTPGEREQLLAAAGPAGGRAVEVTVHDLVTQSQWTIDLLAELATDHQQHPEQRQHGPAGGRAQSIPDALVRVVAAMTASGLSRGDIASRLNGVAGLQVTVSTVDYIRRLVAGTRSRTA